MSIKLGEILLGEKLITEEQLQEALQEQEKTGRRLGYLVVKLGFVKEEAVAAVLSWQYGVPTVDFSKVEIDPRLLKKVSAEMAHKHQGDSFGSYGPEPDGGDGGSDQCLCHG